MVAALYTGFGHHRLTRQAHLWHMMIKALSVLMLFLVAVDYTITGGAYCTAMGTSFRHLFHWLAESGRNSIFSR